VDEIAAAAAFIEARLGEDEALATAAAEPGGQFQRPGTEAGSWSRTGEDWRPEVGSDAGKIVFAEGAPTAAQASHIARHDPARVLRDIVSARSLVAAILNFGHDYNIGDSFYSCSQAKDPYQEGSEPGSGCLNDERAGKPCDCGRDAQVKRLLGIIAGQWEDHPDYRPGRKPGG